MKVSNGHTSNSPSSWLNIRSYAWISIMTSCVVILVAYCLQVPQPEFDWDTHVLPLARDYMGIPSTSTTPTTTTEQHVLQGLTVLLTGVTSGIGEAMTRQLISRGATVIGTGRSMSKLKQLHDSIFHGDAKDSATNAAATVGRFIPIVMEMSDLESVRMGADEIKAMLEVGGGGQGHNDTSIIRNQIASLDVIICNAGMHYGKSTSFASWFETPTTPQGYDVVFVVNYLSHVLLVEKLLPTMLQQRKQHKEEAEQNNSFSAKTTSRPYRRYPTVVHITSSYHWGVDGRDLISHHHDDNNKNQKMPLAATPGTATWAWRSTRSYANSKLAQIYHSRVLKETYSTTTRGTDDDSQKISLLRVVNVCPAWVATAIAGKKGSLLNTIIGLVAFPVDGWGLASTWVGLLDYKNAATTSSTTNSPPPSDNENYDFYINTQMSRVPDLYFPNQLAMSPWVSDWGLRSMIADTFAMCIMFWGQKFFPMAASAPSSVESYNMTIARNLNEWSMTVLAEYL